MKVRCIPRWWHRKPYSPLPHSVSSFLTNPSLALPSPPSSLLDCGRSSMPLSSQRTRTHHITSQITLYPCMSPSHWIPGLCSLMGILVINVIDKDRIRGDEGFGDVLAVWRARLFLFVGFALMAGGLALEARTTRQLCGPVGVCGRCLYSTWREKSIAVIGVRSDCDDIVGCLGYTHSRLRALAESIRGGVCE